MKAPGIPSSVAERAEIVAALLEKLRRAPQSGVAEAFPPLFRLYYAPLCQFFVNLGCSPAECEDLTQETFYGIYTGIGSFRREAGFDTWLFTIATNAFRKHRRRNAAGKRDGQEVPVEDAAELARAGPSPEDEALSNERTQRLREAVERLPEQQRKCVLFYLQGSKYREIAIFMALSTETIKAHLHHAKRRLREELGSQYGPTIDALDKEAE